MFWLGVIAFIGGIVACIVTGSIGGILVTFFASLWIMFAILAIAQEHGDHVKTEENSKSLTLGLSGLLLQFLGSPNPRQHRSLLSDPILGPDTAGEMSHIPALMVVVGTFLLIWRLCYYAKAKGRSGYWGFCGLLSIFGVIILALLRNDHQQAQLPEQEGNEGQPTAPEPTAEPPPDTTPPRFRRRDWARGILKNSTIFGPVMQNRWLLLLVAISQVVLFSIIVIAVGLSWSFLNNNFGSENAVALRALEKLGARTQSYKDASLFMDTRYWRGHHIRVTFYGTHIYNPDIDAGLVHCSKVTNLTGLYLYGKTISDAGLVHLQGLTKLKYLRITGNARISNAELQNLAGLVNLSSLSLSLTSVTAEGLAKLRGLSNLSRLNLHRCYVTDAAVEHLKHLKNLRIIDLTRTPFTDVGYAELKKALPKCEIRYTPNKNKAQTNPMPLSDKPAEGAIFDPTPPEDE